MQATSWEDLLPKHRGYSYLVKPADWREIFAGPRRYSGMADWISTHSESDWILAGPELFWISPELYTLWLLKYR